MARHAREPKRPSRGGALPPDDGSRGAASPGFGRSLPPRSGRWLALSATVAAALAALAGWSYLAALRARKRVEDAEQREATLRHELLAGRDLAERRLEEARRERSEALAAAAQARADAEETLAARDLAARELEGASRGKREALAALGPQSYVDRILQAQLCWKENNVPLMCEHLDACPAGLRGWEWGRLHYLAHQDARTFAGQSRVLWGVAYSRDGKLIATAGANPDLVTIWDAATGEKLRTIPKHDKIVRCVDFSPDGRRLASGSSDRTVRIWDVETGRELQRLEGHRSFLMCVAFSPDGKKLVSGAANDKAAIVWDAETGRRIATLAEHEHWPTGVAFSPNGGRLATADDYRIRIWDTGTWGLLLTLRENEAMRLTSIDFSPDGKLIASGDGKRHVKVWDALTGRQLVSVVRGHEKSVSSVAFGPDGERVASGSSDRTIRLWDARTGKAVVTIRGKASVHDIAYGRGGATTSPLSAGAARSASGPWEVTVG